MKLNTNKKMMVSLYGLALSSLFVLNNKSVVHADTVDSSQNNAISWDSDNDNSQVVSDTQTKTEQAMPQKADDSQQNATQPVQNNAKTSTVRSSSQQPRTTNQNNAENSSAINDQNSRANLISKVDDALAGNKVEIKNPVNNQVHVHYVDANGNDIKDATGKVVNVGDYDIDTSKTIANGQYQAPKGYQLVNEGKYNVNVSSQVKGVLNADTYVYFGKNGQPAPSDVPDIKLSNNDAETIHKLSAKYESKIIDQLKDGTLKINQYYDGNHSHVFETNGTDIPELSDFTYALWQFSSFVPGTFSEHHAPTDYDKYNFSLNFLGTTKTGHKFRGYWSPTIDANDATLISDIWSRTTGQDYKKAVDYDWSHNQEGGTGWRFLEDTSNATFINTSVFDTTGVQSSKNNVVNVAVTKPQSVNPATDTRCQASATRIIHVNFPDGQIPVSYKGIVDSQGNLKQTVHFTRTATEDALTGNILQYGNWTSDNKDHNFIGFPERTLPRIPGYTLSIKPVQA